MGKIKNFFGKWFGTEFWCMFLIIVLMAAFSIGFQSLLIWISGLFSSVSDVGVPIDAILGLLLVLPVMIGVGLGSDFKGSGSLLLIMVAIIGIYACVVWYFNWFALIGCLVVLLLCLIRLDKIGAEPLLIFGIICTYLLYCIGAYFAMLFNSLEPAIDTYGITVLSIATLCIGLRPAFD